MRKKILSIVFLTLCIISLSSILIKNSNENLKAQNQTVNHPSNSDEVESNVTTSDQVFTEEYTYIDKEAFAIRLSKNDSLPNLNKEEVKKELEILFDQKKKSIEPNDEKSSNRNGYSEDNTKIDDFSTKKYEWVTDLTGQKIDNEIALDTSVANEYKAYIKRTTENDSIEPEVLEVPILVSDEYIYSIGNGVGIKHWKPVFPIKSEDVQNATSKNQLEQKIRQNMPYQLVRLDNHQEIDFTSTVQLFEMKADSHFFFNQIQINFNYRDVNNTTRSYSLTQTTFPEDMVPSEGTWELLPQNTQEAVIRNPLNNSTIGFYGKGMPIYQSGFSAERYPLYWDVRDSDGKHISSTPGPARALVPYVNGTYASPGESFFTHKILDRGDLSKQHFYDITFIKRTDEDGLIGLATYPYADLYFGFELSLEKNMNFLVKTKMYNAQKSERRLALVEAENIAYPDKTAKVVSLANNAGIKSSYQSNSKSLMVRYKDYQNNWLSDYQMYGWTDYFNIQNIFGDNFNIPGLESQNLSAGDIISTNMNYGALESGIAYKNVKAYEGITGAYEIFFGDEIPYMELASNPQSFDVYSDETESLQADYTLKKIPKAGDQGTIYVNYSDDAPQEVLTSFIANAQKEFSGTLMIPRNKFPDQLIPDEQASHTYYVDMLAINETEGESYGLPSENYTIDINVYRFNAKPAPQLIAQNSTWTKQPKELLKDIEHIPNNNVTFTYENPTNPINTSKVGLHWVDVIMTDHDKNRSMTIKVPVTVEGEETERNDELVLYAEDFSMDKTEVENMDNQQLKQFILTQAKAIAWYYDSGESDGITIDVAQTNLTNNPTPYDSYQATIRATGANSLTADRVINITVTGEEESPVLHVPEALEFKDVSVPFTPREPAKQVKRKIPDWSIEVTDSRNRPKNWTLMATLTEDFKHVGGNEELMDILSFKATPQSTSNLLVKDQAIEIYKENAAANGTKQLSWDEKAGFLLDISLEQSLEIKKGNYQAEVTFTLADVE